MRAGLRLDMPKYIYILSGEEPFSETELKWTKEEVCRLFKCTDLSVSEGKVLTLHSPFAPEDLGHLEPAVKKLRLQVKAGGRID